MKCQTAKESTVIIYEESDYFDNIKRRQNNRQAIDKGGELIIYTGERECLSVSRPPTYMKSCND